MALSLLAVMLAVAGAAPAGPDGDAISRLEFSESMSLCHRFYHVVPCPTERQIIRDVRCVDEGEERTRCRYTSRFRHERRTQSCTARFLRLQGGGWIHVPLPGPLPHAALPQGDRFEVPVCSATGAPGAAAVRAARSAAEARLSCRIYPEAKKACPAGSARVEELRCAFGSARGVEELRCAFGSARGVAHCDYRLFASEEYFCRARFRRDRGDWALIEDRGVDGRVSFDENCSGPIVR